MRRVIAVLLVFTIPFAGARSFASECRHEPSAPTHHQVADADAVPLAHVDHAGMHHVASDSDTHAGMHHGAAASDPHAGMQHGAAASDHCTCGCPGHCATGGCGVTALLATADETALDGANADRVSTPFAHALPAHRVAEFRPPITIS